MHKIIISDHAHVGEARRFATLLASEAGFDTSQIAKIAIIVTEAAMNIIKHANAEGEILLEVYQDSFKSEFQLYAIDEGRGVSNTSICIQDGYSTANTPGIGLGAIKRLTSQFEFYSSVNQGTVLWAKIEKPLPTKSNALIASKSSSLLEWGVICVPMAQEEVSGDAWSTYTMADNTQLFMLVDGLGHGPDAYLAASEAVKIFNEKSHASLTDILLAQHTALKKTRGAAIAIIKIDPLCQQATYLGVGNISGTILTSLKHYSMLSYSGIVGHQFRTIHEMKYPFNSKSILVMHSDGLSHQWGKIYSGELLRQSPATIAGILYRGFKHKRDDTSVLVAKVKSISR
ncbi:MAG: Stage sporulation protein [Gammaproteobacteria bacterium]|jgi:anti-sigma regulatory factor (Ser/Thr protein kinase)|nr:Stage sporulation protein [Gammaproteobacteria bacterium]